MNYVDVAVDVPALRADGLSLAPRESPDVYGSAGIDVTLGAWRVPRANLQMVTGLHLTAESEADFHAAVWEVPVEGGYRWYAPKDAPVRAYWELGGGPHLYMLLVSYAPPIVDAGFGMHTGFGATVGKGEVRAVLGVRGSAVMGFDSVSVNVTTPEGVRSMDWSPLSARLHTYAGVTFR